MRVLPISGPRGYSTNDRQNTQRQIEDLTRFANSNDYSIVGTYEEHISGATKNENRTVLAFTLRPLNLQVLKPLEILHEAGVSVYIQNLGIYTLNATGEANPIASIMVTVLAEMANIERSNIVYRLNSGRESYIANGGKLGRKKGSVKTTEQKKEEYKEVISFLKRGYSVRNTATLSNVSVSTVQRVKREFGI